MTNIHVNRLLPQPNTDEISETAFGNLRDIT